MPIPALLALLAAAAPAPAPPTVPLDPMTPDIVAGWHAPPVPDADYVRRVVMVPMRDGVRLNTIIVFRRGARAAPILLSRSPYDADKATSRTASPRIEDVLPIADAEFVRDNYIRVYQDVRGKYGSEGDYVMARPLRGPLNRTAVDHSTDAWDTIDWLVRNVPEGNGRVAIVGSSYLGYTALMALVRPHPALKAAVPQSPMVDGWRGDDWFHNGAYRQVNFPYITEQTSERGDGPGIPFGVGDQYDIFLAAGSAGDFAHRYGLDRYPAMQKVLQHPAYDAYWQEQAVDRIMARNGIAVPTMLVVGEWDQEDSYGAPAVFDAVRRAGTATAPLSIVVGPWRHSGVNYDGSALGALRFAGDTALQFRRDMMKPFLDFYLKPGAPAPEVPAVYAYASGADRWERRAGWQTSLTPLYLAGDLAVKFEKPAPGRDDYVSDPARPVPFLPRPIDMNDGDQWKPWLVRDQRFVDGRPDVLSYRGAPLARPLHIAGAPVVDLYAATSGSDADWVVKLIDVYPAENGAHPELAGYQLALGIEIFRGRYRESFEKPSPIPAGAVQHYRFALPTVDHVFQPGHRLMVQVQSSLFPLYDRNPQSYVPNIFYAKPGDYRRETMSIARGGAQASAILLPIVAD